MGDVIIFETDPPESSDTLFQEIGETYRVENGFHLGKSGNSDTNQTTTSNAIINIPYFNTFSWGNGAEGNRIRGLRTGTLFSNATKPLGVIDSYRRNVRIASLTYSGVYDQTTNYNALNEFNLSLINYKDLDDSFGEYSEALE